MRWETVQRDFVERTLKIVEQYDDYRDLKYASQEGFDELEVTLLVNCLTGLIVVPYEYATRGSPKRGSIEVCQGDTVAIKNLCADWGLENAQIDNICDFEHKPIQAVKDATLRLFIYRIRNAIAHSRFEDGTKTTDGIGVVYQVTPYDPNHSLIEKLIFQDQDNRFRSIIAVNDLRQFAQKFAKTILSRS